jgi:hypothetical protein
MTPLVKVNVVWMAREMTPVWVAMVPPNACLAMISAPTTTISFLQLDIHGG